MKNPRIQNVDRIEPGMNEIIRVRNQTDSILNDENYRPDFMLMSVSSLLSNCYELNY